MGLLPTFISATRPDPNRVRRLGGSGRLGGPGEAERRGEFATVINYQTDRYTATVRTERGRTLTGVPRLRSSSGEIVALPPGAEVLLTYDYGMPLILGVLTIPAAGNEGSDALPVSEITDVGGNAADASTITSRGNFRLASEPRDVIPGDWVQTGSDGSLFALLGGGTAVMRGSALAQVRAHMLQDLIEIISRNYRQVTDMGEFTISNNDGHVNMRFRGASDQLTETGVDEERWTIKMDLGSEGDIFNFELCTPTGQTLFKIHVDSSGSCEIFGVNGVALTSGSRAGGRHVEEHTADSTRTITGNRESTTRGDETRVIDGNASTTIGGNCELNAYADMSIFAGRDTTLGAGRNLFLNVLGDTTAPTGNALTFDISSGNWVVNVGAATSPLGKAEINTQTGDINLKSILGGTINLDTPLGNIKTMSQTIKIVTAMPDSVILGGETLTSHLVKYEELERHLQSIYAAIDAHTHPVSGTATNAPTVPVCTPLQGTLTLAKSLLAGVTG